jgi:hypothetical protein
MKTTPNDELEFAYKVRRVLDEGIEDLPKQTMNRLAAARKLAIAHKKPESALYSMVPVPRLAGIFSTRFNDTHNWFVRIGIMIPLLVLVFGSVSLYYYEQQRSINDLADLDAAVLADELPIDAYLDHGFDTYLNKHGE